MKAKGPPILLAAALLGIWLARRAPEPPPEVPAAPPAVAAVPKPAFVHSDSRETTPAKAARPPKLGAHPAPGRPPESNPEGNVVHFTVQDGLAIAYGDLILGEPEDPALRDGFYETPPPQLWERPELPYAIRPELAHPERVRQAIEHLQSRTPVRFVPYDGSQPDAIVFEPGKENCYSLLGRQGGLQPIKLSGDCGWLEVTHEILHALGFVHEQSRTDRDRYLEILWPNIDEKMRPQFAQVPDSFMEASRQGAFDYQSIMLYPTSMFAAHEGVPTMRSLNANAISPSENGLSRGDIEKITQLYRPYAK